MYVRIRRIEVRPGAHAEAYRIWQDRIIPNLQQQKGFHHIYITQPQEGNQIVIIFLWATKEDAEAWVSQATTQQLLGPLGPLTASPPITEELQLITEA